MLNQDGSITCKYQDNDYEFKAESFTPWPTGKALEHMMPSALILRNIEESDKDFHIVSNGFRIIAFKLNPEDASRPLHSEQRVVGAPW